jgi:multidrug efflux pump subunit AcrA (membrane-fusion protein)
LRFGVVIALHGCEFILRLPAARFDSAEVSDLQDLKSMLRLLLHVPTVILCAAFLLLNADPRSLQAENRIQAESVLLRLIDQVDVPARAAGPLVKLDLVEGQAAKRGEVLARVDDSGARLVEQRVQIELALAKTKAANNVPVRAARSVVEFAKAELKRLQDAALAVRRSVSESELDEARQKLAQSELDLENALEATKVLELDVRLKQSDLLIGRREIKLCEIICPLDGMVSQIYKELGEWVNPGENVCRVVSIGRLRAEGFVPAERLLGDLHGAPVSIVADLAGVGSTEFSGKVVYVFSEIDPVNKQARIWAEVDNTSRRLRPGMRVEMTILPRRSPTTSRQTGPSPRTTIASPKTSRSRGKQ